MKKIITIIFCLPFLGMAQNTPISGYPTASDVIGAYVPIAYPCVLCPTGFTTKKAPSTLFGIGLTALSASSPLNYNNTTGAFSIQPANGSLGGYITNTDWIMFNGKQNALTLTTTGTSGAATLIGNTLNIPQYLGGVSSFNSRTGDITPQSSDYSAFYAPYNASTNVQTSNYAPILTDAGIYVDYNSASAGNITINDTGTVSWVSGNVLTITQKSTGAFTIVAGGSTTFINSSGTLVSQGSGSVIQLRYLGSNVWLVIGGGKTVPTLTDGSIPFYSSTAGNLSQSNSKLFYDIGNDRLGLGNTTPGSTLDIRDNTLTNLTGASITSGFTLSNLGTANSSAFSMEPPSIYFKGQGFQGGTTSTTESVRIRLVPGPSDYQLRFSGYLTGSTYADLFWLSSTGITDSGGKWKLSYNGNVSTNTIAFISTTTMLFNASSGVSGSIPSIKHSTSSAFAQTSGTYPLVNNNHNVTSASGTAVFSNSSFDGTINNSGNGVYTVLNIIPTVTATGGDFIGLSYNPSVTSITGQNYILNATSGQLQLPTSMVAAGTTGNRTANTITGNVRIAAGGTTVTVTNNTVTANSLVDPTLATADATAWIKSCTRTAGSFTITLGAAATSEVEITWEVKNR